MKEIKGKFSIKATPIESHVAEEIGLAHMKFEKQFEGLLNATGLVAMMGLMNQAIGSGGYVALEKIQGELESKKGSFYLQHSSFMSKGVQKQSISVVPDSGTEELTGISGEMTIEIKEGQHYYIFRYML